MTLQRPRQNKTVNKVQVGRDFEESAQRFFAKQGLDLQRNVTVPIGISGRKKPHKFDLGNERVIVECKSHSWTVNDNVPSAKLASWNEAMHIFCAAPRRYRKIFCVMRNYSAKHGKTLAKYYLDTYAHLIPKGVEIWEYDKVSKKGKPLDR